MIPCYGNIISSEILYVEGLRLIIPSKETSFVNPIFPPKQYIINVSHFTRIHICNSLERIWQKKTYWQLPFETNIKHITGRPRYDNDDTERYFKQLLSFFYAFDKMFNYDKVAQEKKFEYKLCFLPPFYFLSKA